MSTSMRMMVSGSLLMRAYSRVILSRKIFVFCKSMIQMLLFQKPIRANTPSFSGEDQKIGGTIDVFGGMFLKRLVLK